MQARCSQFPNVQQVMHDSSITLTHACVAGAAGCTAEAETVGRSKGGLTAKIHAMTDVLGNALDFILTGGQGSDIRQAEKLWVLKPEGVGALLGDKGFDSDVFIQAVIDRSIQLFVHFTSQQPNQSA